MKNNLPIFLQFLYVTTNIEHCVDERFAGDSVRIVILQENDHTQETLNFAETVIKYAQKSSRRTLQLEEKFITNEATNLDAFSSIKTHLIITWDAQVLHRFLDENPKIVVPVPRDKYKIFLITTTPKWKAILSRFWLDFGVLNIYFCKTGKPYHYLPFSLNLKGTWGLVTRNNSMVKLKNFNRFPIKISMFVRNATAIVKLPKLLKYNLIYLNLKSSRFLIGGLDGSMLMTIAEHFNFDLDFIGGLGTEDFGTVLPNGSITGTLGVTATGQAQISTNGRFVMDYGTQDIEFTVPYDSDKMCAMVPKSEKVPLWLIVFHCFSTLTWLSAFFTYLICNILWYYIGPHRKSVRVFWEIYSIFLGIPVKITPTLSQAFFLLWCLVFNIIMVNVIQGSFFKFFTTPIYYKDIDTLEELDEANILIATNFYKFDGDASPLMASLKKKRIQSVPDLLSVVAYNRTIALLQRKREMDAFLKTHYLADDGTPLIHIANECLTSYFIAYIVPRGSALLDIFNVIILKIVESGLALKWYQDIEYSIMVEELFSLNIKKQLWRPFAIYDLQAAFYLWIMGLNISLVIFLLEIFFKKRCHI